MASQKKRQTKKTKSNKKTKKQPIFLTVIFVIAIIFGSGGYLTFNLLTKNDKFEIVGEKNITLAVGEDYVEQGAKIISFGRDRSESLQILESTVDTSVAGEYYVKYSSTDYRFKNVIRYRYVVVEEEGE